MTTVLLVLLFAFDFLILGILLLKKKRADVEDTQIMSDIHHERDSIQKLRENIRAELDHSRSQSKELLSQVKRVAAEAEQEVKGGSNVIIRDVNNLAQEAARHLETPLHQLTEKHLAVENLLRKTELQRLSLQKLVTRAEQIAKFFDQRINYEEVLDEIEDKKYVDARALLAKGVSAHEVAQDLSMSLSEVRLLAGVTGFGSR
jgi:hypothetical protein